MARKWGFSVIPSHQRSNAPRLAPTLMAAIAFHMSHRCTVQRERHAMVTAGSLDAWSVVGAGVNMQPRYWIGLGGSMRVSRWLVAAGVMLMVVSGQAGFSPPGSAPHASPRRE